MIMYSCNCNLNCVTWTGIFDAGGKALLGLGGGVPCRGGSSGAWPGLTSC